MKSKQSSSCRGRFFFFSPARRDSHPQRTAGQNEVWRAAARTRLKLAPFETEICCGWACFVGCYVKNSVNCPFFTVLPFKTLDLRARTCREKSSLFFFESWSWLESLSYALSTFFQADICLTKVISVRVPFRFVLFSAFPPCTVNNGCQKKRRKISDLN